MIRDAINTAPVTEEERKFLQLALTDSLRTASKAGTGWPYIAPSKYHEKIELPALSVFHKTVWGMYQDLVTILTRYGYDPAISTQVLLRDTRQPYPIDDEAVDLVITSPPYLNNYDYADRTRLETYFFGWASSWRDITEQVRDKLIIAATTQIRRGEFHVTPLSSDIQAIAPELWCEISEKIDRLAEQRLTKGGKKSYDLMVAGYFNHMVQMLSQVQRVLKPNHTFALVLGDSAPYGVHIPTEEYLGRLGIALGYQDYQFHNLRERGGKWKHNPQRHNVMLKEGILFLKK